MGGGPSKNREEYIDIVNEVYSEAVVSSIQDCSSTIDVAQVITSECNGFIRPNDPGFIDDATGIKRAFTENRSALECTQARDVEIRRLWEEAGGDLNALNLTGICDHVERECITQNIQQTGNVGFTANCQITNEVVQTIQNKFNTDIKQMLTEDKDALGQLAEVFGVFGPNEEDKVSTIITNRVSNVTNTQLVQDLSNRVSIRQEVRSSGRSIYIDGLTFAADATFMAKNLQQNRVFNEIVSEAEATALQSIVDRNNTIGDVARTVARTFEDIAGEWQSALAIIGVVVVILIFGGALIALFLFIQTGKNLTKPLDNLIEVFGDDEARANYAAQQPPPPRSQTTAQE